MVIEMELSEKDKERLRQGWRDMYAHDAENLSGSPSPHSGFLTVLNEGLRKIQEIENIETTVRELHEKTDAMLKRARKIHDLGRRLNALERKR